MFLVKCAKVVSKQNFISSIFNKASSKVLSLENYTFSSFSTQFLDDNGHDESSVLLSHVHYKISNRHYIDLSLIEKAKSVLHKSGLLNESNACILLLLCGKKLCASTNNKLDTAHSIFQLAEPKTIQVVNDLLQVYLDCESEFDCMNILKRIGTLNLVPNKDTFVKLLAENCLEGKLGNAYQILLLMCERELVIPLEVYGYFAFAFCKAGHINKALKLIDELLKTFPKLSWDIYSMLFCGLAIDKNINVLESALNKYHLNFEDDLTIFHVLKMLSSFLHHKKESAISNVIQFMNINQPDIIIASHHMKRFPQMTSALFLKELFKHCKGTLNSYSVLTSYKRVLAYYVCNQNNFNEFWNTVLLLRGHFSNSNIVDYLALAMILKFKPDFYDLFIEELSKINIVLEMPLPTDVALLLKNIGLELEELLPNINNCLAESAGKHTKAISY